MEKNNYLVIQGWMITDLCLKGNELLIYAIIYGFSQCENQCYSGSLKYLAEWTSSTKQGVVKCLKSLVVKGYIKKEEKYINNVKFCEYYATNFNGVLTKIEHGIKQSLPNNIEYNINIKEKENNIKEKEKIANANNFKIKQYVDLYSIFIKNENFLFKLYQELHIDVSCIKQLLFIFTYRLNKEKSSNALKYIEHFKNWLKTDSGKKAINDIKLSI